MKIDLKTVLRDYNAARKTKEPRTLVVHDTSAERKAQKIADADRAFAAELRKQKDIELAAALSRAVSAFMTRPFEKVGVKPGGQYLMTNAEKNLRDQLTTIMLPSELTALADTLLAAGGGIYRSA